MAQPKGRAQATVAVIDRRRRKPRRYSSGALVVLRQVWAVSGGSCGKYLAVSIPELLNAFEVEGALVVGEGRP